MLFGPEGKGDFSTEYSVLSTENVTLAKSPNCQVRMRLAARRTSSGDHTVVETPVPIPNTVVKHPGPMIVRALAKVGIARFYGPVLEKFKTGLFM